jgi:hypothetical protein
VTAGVVDVLEVVDVEEEHRDRTGTALQQPVGRLDEQRPVGEPGQLVTQPLLLVEPPGGEVREAGGQHECAVQSRPGPGIVVGGPMAEDRVRDERADETVVGQDDDQRHAEGHPVLVEGDQPDHHEEVEVCLGQPVHQIDQQHRGCQQAQRRGGGRQGPPGPGRGQERDGDRGRHGADLKQRQQRGLSAQDRHDAQHHGLGQGDPDDDAVPPLPDLVRQQSALGEGRGDATGESLQHIVLSARSLRHAPRVACTHP